MDWNVFGNLGAAFVFVLGLVRIERRLFSLEGKVSVLLTFLHRNLKK